MNYNQPQWLEEEKLKILSKEMENDSIERCESPKAKDKIAKAICAFSNNLANGKEPSVIFIGIKDNGQYADLPVTDEILCNIASIRSDGNLQPLPIINIKKLSIEKHEIIAVQVQSSKNPPMRYKNVCWVRIGPSVRMASEEEEKILMERRNIVNLPDDMKQVIGADIDVDLNMDYFKTQYLSVAVSAEVFSANNRDTKIQMRSLRLLDHKYIPTMAAILLMGKNPRNWFPGAYIQFIRFEGKELTDPIKNQKEISGTLPDQIIRVEELLESNISISLSLSDKQHIESPDYPMTALNQIVRNAIIHRNYTSNTPIKIYWFNDRIEIQSPGGPYGELNIDNFGTEGITSYRNPVIAEALKNLGFIERFGFGIPQSKKALKENRNPALKLKAELSSILAIIRKAQ